MMSPGCRGTKCLSLSYARHLQLASPSVGFACVPPRWSAWLRCVAPVQNLQYMWNLLVPADPTCVNDSCWFSKTLPICWQLVVMYDGQVSVFRKS